MISHSLSYYTGPEGGAARIRRALAKSRRGRSSGALLMAVKRGLKYDRSKRRRVTLTSTGRPAR